MNWRDFLAVACDRYCDKADTFVVTIGHQALPFPGEAISRYNLPEIQCDIAITAGDLRRWLSEA